MVPASNATASPKSMTNRPSVGLMAARCRQSAPLPVKTKTSPPQLWPPQSLRGAAMTAVEPCRATAWPNESSRFASAQVSLSRCVHVDPLRVYT